MYTDCPQPLGPSANFLLFLRILTHSVTHTLSHTHANTHTKTDTLSHTIEHWSGANVVTLSDSPNTVWMMMRLPLRNRHTLIGSLSCVPHVRWLMAGQSVEMNRRNRWNSWKPKLLINWKLLLEDYYGSQFMFVIQLVKMESYWKWN